MCLKYWLSIAFFMPRNVNSWPTPAQRLKDQTNYTPQDQTQPLFETHIQPLLANKFIDCHQGDEAKGGLRLDQLIHLYEGGTSGPILEPGNAQKSFLFHITASKEMPPASHDTPLTMEELELLRIWIESGAKAKQAVDLTVMKKNVKYWAFRFCNHPNSQSTRRCMDLVPILMTSLQPN